MFECLAFLHLFRFSLPFPRRRQLWRGGQAALYGLHEGAILSLFPAEIPWKAAGRKSEPEWVTNTVSAEIVHRTSKLLADQFTEVLQGTLQSVERVFAAVINMSVME